MSRYLIDAKWETSCVGAHAVRPFPPSTQFYPIWNLNSVICLQKWTHHRRRVFYNEILQISFVCVSSAITCANTSLWRLHVSEDHIDFRTIFQRNDEGRKLSILDEFDNKNIFDNNNSEFRLYSNRDIQIFKTIIICSRYKDMYVWNIDTGERQNICGSGTNTTHISIWIAALCCDAHWIPTCNLSHISWPNILVYHIYRVPCLLRACVFHRCAVCTQCTLYTIATTSRHPFDSFIHYYYCRLDISMWLIYVSDSDIIPINNNNNNNNNVVDTPGYRDIHGIPTHIIYNTTYGLHTRH